MRTQHQPDDRRAASRLAAVTCAAGLALTGCGLEPGSTAAEVGGSTITMDQVQQQLETHVEERTETLEGFVQELDGQAADQARTQVQMEGEVDEAEAARSITEQRILWQLADKAATEFDVSVSDADLAATVSETEQTIDQMPMEQYLSQFASYHLTEDTMREWVRWQLLLMELGPELQDSEQQDPTTPPDPDQTLAALLEWAENEGVNVEVNPRFGEWGAESLLAAGGGALVDLEGGQAGDEQSGIPQPQ